MVKSDAPVAVVEGGDCMKVCSDPFKVSSTLMFRGFRVPVEGKGKHSLAISTQPRLRRTGGRGLQFWESEKRRVQEKG